MSGVSSRANPNEIDFKKGDKMKRFALNLKKLDPRKYGYDYGMSGSIVFDANLFCECPSCKGRGEIEVKQGKEIKIERCVVCDGTGAVAKDIYFD